MSDAATRLERIRSLAWLLTALVLAVVAVSAWVRLAGAGLGCADWPACYGRLLIDGGSLHVGGIRILHRITATASLLLAFWVTWLCLRPAPLQPAARQATLLIVLMLMLSVVGIWSNDPHRVLVSFVNILGGLALVSLSWRIVGAAQAQPPAATEPPRRDALLLVAMHFLAVTLALGALIGARYAAPACATLIGCAGVFWPAAEGWRALNPAVTLAAATGPGDAGGVALHLLHRYAAVVTVALLAAAAVRACSDAVRRGPALWVLALVAVELALGLLTVASGFSLLLAIMHSVCAAMLLAAVATLYRH